MHNLLMTNRPSLIFESRFDIKSTTGVHNKSDLQYSCNNGVQAEITIKQTKIVQGRQKHYTTPASTRLQLPGNQLYDEMSQSPQTRKMSSTSPFQT